MLQRKAVERRICATRLEISRRCDDMDPSLDHYTSTVSSYGDLNLIGT
jgi:hypothetical protein